MTKWAAVVVNGATGEKIMNSNYALRDSDTKVPQIDHETGSIL